MFGKKRRKSTKPEEVALGRVVTPMLDMTFQLLFFFVMQFKPPISEGQIDFNLPSESVGGAAVSDKLDEKPDEYKVIITAPSGIPTLIDWKEPAVGNPKTIFPDENQPMITMIGALEDKLKTISKPPPDKVQPIIKIEADKRLKYLILVQIMDSCKKLGFNDVGVMKKAEPSAKKDP